MRKNRRVQKPPPGSMAFSLILLFFPQNWVLMAVVDGGHPFTRAGPVLMCVTRQYMQICPLVLICAPGATHWKFFFMAVHKALFGLKTLSQNHPLVPRQNMAGSWAHGAQRADDLLDDELLSQLLLSE